MRKKTRVLLGTALMAALLAFSPLGIAQASAAHVPARSSATALQPQIGWQYHQGFRVGYRWGHADGWADGRFCNHILGHRDTFHLERFRRNDFERGWEDGYSRGYDSGFWASCHRH
ncbi:hypothetical protein [Saccharopolyspora rosea]|uniref:Uncharacterized protein n=1 Tax=Saccharopolyspora rosea TaxID=524884 RepID=A0ABW3FRQ8_9PSEU|nr:hypothetical protein [Saccharopolyspora rosea]